MYIVYLPNKYVCIAICRYLLVCLLVVLCITQSITILCDCWINLLVFLYFKTLSTNKMYLLQGHHAGNLLRHFFTQHRVEYNKIIARTSTDKDVNPPAEHDEVLKCCINLVAIHGRPLSLKEDEAFQNLIALIPNCDSKPSITKIKSCIESKAYDIRKKIHEELKNKLVCLKIDVASVKSRRFLGINLQFISEDKLQLRNLCVLELHERNTAAFLKDTVLMILSRYGIEAQQLYSITSDNGAYAGNVSSN